MYNKKAIFLAPLHWSSRNEDVGLCVCGLFANIAHRADRAYKILIDWSFWCYWSIIDDSSINWLINGLILMIDWSNFFWKKTICPFFNFCTLRYILFSSMIGLELLGCTTFALVTSALELLGCRWTIVGAFRPLVLFLFL